MSKPRKFAVSMVIFSSPPSSTEEEQKEQKELLLVVQRPENDANLPNVIGLPAGMCELQPKEQKKEEEEETWIFAVKTACLQKLGVSSESIKKIEFLSEGQQERSDYVLVMKQYRVDLDFLKANPSCPQKVPNVTQYQKLMYVEDFGILNEAASKGSLCSRLLLENSALTKKKKENEKEG